MFSLIHKYRCDTPWG